MTQLDLFKPAPDEPAVPPSSLPSAGMWVCRGALAAEAALLARIDELAAAARREPSRLALPVRVVVPSRSLRRHVAAQLVRPRPGHPAPAVLPGQPARLALAGVAVQTLYGVACEVLERSGQAAPRGALLFETLVEREARAEPLLRRGLGELVDGFLTVAASVADLLDAGLEPEHAEAVDEALASDGPRGSSHAEVERTRALVRVAVRTERRLRELDLGRRSTLFRLAAEAMAAAPERAFPARAILLHGFVAAHGVATDLLLWLLRQPGAMMLLDRPPVPAPSCSPVSPLSPPSNDDSESAATARLAERAAGLVAVRPWPAPALPAIGPLPAPAPRLEAFTAVGADAEAREVARRLRRLLAGGGADRDGLEGGNARPEGAAAGEGLEAGRARPEGAVSGEGMEAGKARPESLAVVARDLTPYRVALRRHLRRLGVPFSGVGQGGGLLPAGRRAAAVLDLLRLGPEAPADRWLDASEGLSAALRADLRLALRALGAARLRDVAALRDQAFEGGLALPVRHGLGPATPSGPSASAAAAGVAEGGATQASPKSAPEGDPQGVGLAGEPPPDEDGEGREVARARRISSRRLRLGIQEATSIHDRLRSWPRQASAAAQILELTALLSDLSIRNEPAQPLAVAVATLKREIPAELPLSAEELRLLVARALGGSGQCDLGGEGGGVQVLTVAEARGRTFDRLFLLGLNREVFPRPVREDPLLPDDLRQVLQRVLPDLAPRRAAFDDERHAFAQLLSAAPAVCLSWRVADDDRKPLSASPLVERLLPGLALEAAAPLYPAPAAASSASGRRESTAGARPADEHAVLAGLYGSRRDFARLLPIAVREVRQEWSRPLLELEPEAVAAARLRILDELDPDLRTPAGRAAAARLGPYFGFVGPAPARGGRQLYVTHLEAMAACPWQLFLGRLLRIERPPDPLGALPGNDPLRLGNLVHRALDRIVKRALSAAGPPAVPEALAGLSSAESRELERQATAPRTVAVRWPAAEEIEPLLIEVATEVLAEEGLVLPGLARALASHSRPFVEAAREVDWPDSDAAVAVVASEVEGELVLRGADAGGLDDATRRLRFRADREDVVEGRRRFTDYKTGRTLSGARDPRQRRRKLLAEIRAGRRLQGVAYLLAAAPAPALGRYLFLRPDLTPPAIREVTVGFDDREARAAFAGAVRAVLAAWDGGSFFPRLVDPAGRKEPSRCALCAVAEACLRGDSGARRRLHEWAARARSGEPPEHSAEAALLGVWELAAAVEEAPAGGAAAAWEPEEEG